MGRLLLDPIRRKKTLELYNNRENSDVPVSEGPLQQR